MGIDVNPANFNTKTGKVSKQKDAPDLNEVINQFYTDFQKASFNVENPDKATFARLYQSIIDNRVYTKSKASANAKKLNSRLDNLRLELIAAEIEVARIKQEITDWEDITNNTTGKLFTDFVKQYTQDVPLSESTIIAYNSVHADFIIFNPRLKFADITASTLSEYEKHLLNRHVTGTDKSVRNSTVKNYLSKIRAVYRYYAESRGLNPTALNGYKTQIKSFKAPILFFTTSELQQLQELKLKSKSYESVRDLMLLMTYTGLRFSDAFIRKQHIKGEYITLTTKKTNTTVKIPLSDNAKKVLERWNYEMPKFRISYFNNCIKDICSLIPSMVTELEPVTTLSGKINDTQYVERYKVISAHVGRKTFTTHALAAGINPAVLKGWLGHSKIEMLMNHYASGQHNTPTEMGKLQQVLPNEK